MRKLTVWVLIVVAVMAVSAMAATTSPPKATIDDFVANGINADTPDIQGVTNYTIAASPADGDAMIDDTGYNVLLACDPAASPGSYATIDVGKNRANSRDIYLTSAPHAARGSTMNKAQVIDTGDRHGFAKISAADISPPVSVTVSGEMKAISATIGGDNDVGSTFTGANNHYAMREDSDDLERATASHPRFART